MRREAIAFVVVASLLLLTATGVRATATKTPPLQFCEYVTATPGAVGRTWTDDSGVFHWRNQPWTSEVWTVDHSTFVAKNAGWESGNLDANGNGDKVGYFNDGTFVGRYSGTYVTGVASVQFVGHGPGNQQMSGTILEPSAACTGGGNLVVMVILNPHS